MSSIVINKPGVIADYQNGNVHVILKDDGTRIMECPDGEEWNFEFPCSADVTITTKCDGGCPYCYLGCTPNGKDADLYSSLIDSFHPGMEIAINLNSMDHKQLISFLQRMKDRGVIVNGTVNQIHFERHNEHILKTLCDNELIHGLGISAKKPTPEFVRKVKYFPNAVIHVINGLWTAEDIEVMKDNGLKVLILGYKTKGRGVEYKETNGELIKRNQEYLYDILPELPKMFKVISFDNLAISQLDVRRIVPEGKWDEFYQGDEGTCSMFIDLVNGYFARSSLIDDPARKYPLTNNIDEMFKVVKNGG